MADEIIAKLKDIFAVTPPFGQLLGREFKKIEDNRTPESVDAFRRYLDMFNAFPPKAEVRELLVQLKEALSK
ncbi:MAG: hypothetical protein ACRC5C_10385 [Bacilli bacterium]